MERIWDNIFLKTTMEGASEAVTREKGAPRQTHPQDLQGP